MPVTETFDVLVPSRVTVSTPDPVLTHTITPITPPPVNLPPVANAGPNQSLVIPANANSINSTLNGSQSSDPEGKPLTYGWRKVSGPNATIVSPTSAITAVNNLLVGTYVYELRVVDPAGLFGAATMTIVVTKAITPPPVNVPPLADAGDDQTIFLPGQTSFVLDASLSKDPDGQIKSYLWKQTLGPAATTTDVTKPVLQVSNLQEAIYTFGVTVTDNNDATSGDTVTITVKTQVVTPPVSATYDFTLTKNTAAKRRIFSGYENWNGQNYATIYGGGWNDMYFRFVANDFVKGADAHLDWSRFDQEFKKAATIGAGFSFAVFLVNDSDDFLSSETYGGGNSRYCLGWHNQMQAEGVKDFIKNGMWIPNWNSPSLLANFKNLLIKINDRLNTQTFNGKKWKDYINYVDIREYGQWGEWHNGGLFDNINQYPAGTRPSVASYKTFIDSHLEAFPDVQTVCLFAAYDANWLPHTMTPPEVTDYVLKASNAAGLIGWRRDQWGQTDNYIHDYLENNNRSYGTSGPFRNIIMERWKVAPVQGEPYGPGADLSDLKRQVEFYHANSIGNGNYSGNDTNSKNLFTAAQESAGAKISLPKGQLKVSTEFDFDIALTFESFGNCPLYDKRLQIVYELRDSTGKILWTAPSPFDVTKKMGVLAISDHYKVTNIPTGTHSLYAVIKNNLRPLPLFNSNQQSDGYLLLSNKVKF